VAGCQRAVFYSWLHGDNVPRIDKLMRTWYRLKLPVACLVDGVYPGFSPEMRAERSHEVRSVRRAVPRRSPGQIRRALETALREEPAPALHEIARRLGYTTTARLHSADRDLCRQIILNHRKSGRSAGWRKRAAKPICESSRMKRVLEEHLASSSPIPSLLRIAADLGYAVSASLWKKFPELCRALWARTADQKRMRVAAIEPALEQALRETPPPSLRQMARRLGFSATCVLKAHAPALYEKVKARWQSHVEECRTELGIKLAAVLDENPPPSLRSVYSRFGVTEAIVNTSFPDLRRKIGLRHLQYQKRQTQVRRDAVRAEVREIVRMLHAQGTCPSVPRVRSLLQSSLPREWGIIHKAVNDARRELSTECWKPSMLIENRGSRSVPTDSSRAFRLTGDQTCRQG
jgi:hypothetical protein